MNNRLAATVAICALGQGAGAAMAQDNTLNIYNWSDYIAEDTIANFEEETGITVNYDVFDSNEVLEAKLLTGSTGYDLVVPSLEFMARQAQAGVFAPIDKAALANYGNLDTEALALIAADDPDNTFGVPYMQYTTGVGYNVAAVSERIDADKVGTWDMVFDPETAALLADCGITLLDSPTEIVGAALNYLGLDPNSEETADLEAATALITGTRSSIRYYNSSQYINDLANGDVCVSVGYSGDILQARDRAAEAGQGVEVAYAIPPKGAQVGFDMLAIPADAPHMENALAFVDYLLRPEVAAAITNYVYFANANTEATALVDEEVRNDPGIYPPAEVSADLWTMSPHSPRFDRAVTRAWTTIKTGQ